MATSALLSENSFSNDRPFWDGIVPSSLNWTYCKIKFVHLNSAMEREIQSSSQRGESFGSANLAMAAHRIISGATTHPTTNQ